MSRSVLIPAAVLAALTLAWVPAGAAPRDTHANARGGLASVRVAECSRGPAAIDRIAVFRGAMRSVPGTGRMWMRFKLQERVGDGRFQTVKAPGLGVWRKSRPGVGRFAYRQRVLALAEGSAYRTVLAFRWYDGGGEIIRRATRRSRACLQPGPLANLSIMRIGGAAPLPGVPGTYRYAVNLVNDGQVQAERFGVSLAVDGGAVDTQAVSYLAPGESRRLFFAGPACRATVTAVADADDTVRENLEKDNSLTSGCPRSP
jgi:hypothetical protein